MSTNVDPSEDYHDLHRYSVENYTFWLDLWENLAIISSIPPQKVHTTQLVPRNVDNSLFKLQDRIIIPGKLPEIPTWFPDARLNFAENLLYRRDDGIAITEANENGIIAHFTYRQLHERVREMAAALRAHDLKVGDRVAGTHLLDFT